MANLTPIAVAALGAALDALPTAEGVADKHISASPYRLTAALIVSTDTVDLRLYRYDVDLGRWVPSRTAAATVAVGVAELHWDTYGVPGLYALVKTGGSGTAEYVFRQSRS